MPANSRVHKLKDARLLLCVGGGIAAYKTPDIVRQARQAGADVQVAMTRAAAEFITPLTLQTVSGKAVASDLLSASDDATIGHIRIAEAADVVLVAPATADLIARMTAGMADDIVSAALLATTAPVVVAPAMNSHMLEHPAVAANIERLRSWSHRIVEPDRGELACGYEGPGRLPDAAELLEEVAAALTNQDLAGRHVLVSAGPTREALDPVRYLSNKSSGRMGYAVAAAARRRGANVTLVSGPTALDAPRGCELVRIESAAELNEAMQARVTTSEVIVMVAAVADYKPAELSARKIKKGADGMGLELSKTEDVLAGLARARGQRVVVGFAAETDELEKNARKKLVEKKLDLIVANDVTGPDSGFDVDTNAAVLIDRAGEETRTGLLAKDELADRILDRVVGLLAENASSGNRRVRKLGK